MLMAFVYGPYTGSGIRQYCSGLFGNQTDALVNVRGDRYDREFMELLDLETGGFERFKWEPAYEWNDANNTLTHKWDNTMPVVTGLKWRSELHRYDSNNAFYDAGYWKLD